MMEKTNMSEQETIDFRFDDVDASFDFENDPFEEEVKVEEPKKAPESAEEDAEDKPDDEPNPMEEVYLEIFDAIMFEDAYEKTYKLGKKYSVVFSTRPADADMSIARQLDRMKFETMHALQTMSAVLTLSHSLVEFNGKDLRNSQPSERYAYLKERPSHIIELLSRKMIEFDQLVREALTYGEANF